MIRCRISRALLCKVLVVCAGVLATDLPVDRVYWSVEPKLTDSEGTIRVSFTANDRRFDIIASRNDYLIYKDPNPSHCHYQGSLADDPESAVAMSICDNQFVGLIRTKNESFYLEPILNMNLKLQFPSILRRIASHVLIKEVAFRKKMKALFTGSEVGAWLRQRDQRTSIGNSISAWKQCKQLCSIWNCMQHSEGSTHRRIAIINDASRTTRFERETEARTLQIANIADIYYRDSAFSECWRLSIVQQVNFYRTDPFTRLRNVDNTTLVTPMIESLRDWRHKAQFSGGPIDMVHMITGDDLTGGVFGADYIDNVCDDATDVGISEDVGLSLPFMASVFAHEIGHTLGMVHATSGLMVSKISSTDHATRFSMESTNLVNLNPPSCIQSVQYAPHGVPLSSIANRSSINLSTCGNGKLDRHEDCDYNQPTSIANSCCTLSCQVDVLACSCTSIQDSLTHKYVCSMRITPRSAQTMLP